MLIQVTKVWEESSSNPFRYAICISVCAVCWKLTQGVILTSQTFFPFFCVHDSSFLLVEMAGIEPAFLNVVLEMCLAFFLGHFLLLHIQQSSRLPFIPIITHIAKSFNPSFVSYYSRPSTNLTGSLRLCFIVFYKIKVP